MEREAQIHFFLILRIVQVECTNCIKNITIARSRHRHCAHFICRLHCDLIVMAAVAVIGFAHVVAVSLIHEDGAGDIGEGNGHFRDSALDGTRNNGQRIVAYRLHDADGLVVGSSVLL